MAELVENLQKWGEHFREKQHGVTLTILRARRTIIDQSVRIDLLEEVLNRLFHYTDCTTGQMAIIEEVLPQKDHEI
jgi:superfamily II DNA helicase RecQ